MCRSVLLVSGWIIRLVRDVMLTARVVMGRLSSSASSAILISTWTNHGVCISVVR